MGDGGGGSAWSRENFGQLGQILAFVPEMRKILILLGQKNLMVRKRVFAKKNYHPKVGGSWLARPPPLGGQIVNGQSSLENPWPATVTGINKL